MKRKGISLITLVITIVIIIILAGAVILNLTDNNPIESAKKATVMQDIDTFRTELMLKTTTANNLFDTEKINAVTKEDMLEYIPSMKEVKIGSIEYTEILVVSEGELAIDGTKAVGAITNGKLKQKEYDWIVEALGNNVFNAKTYSIKYYANDGTEEYTESSKIHNVKYSILTNSKDRGGYTFDGWNTKEDGTGTDYAVGSSYEENAELKLYAKWKQAVFSAAEVKSNASELYGAYVNYTPTNGYTGKWRVFLADNTRIYLIAEDYVPNSYLTATGLTMSTSTTNNRKDYCVLSSTNRQDLVTRLTTSSYYLGFKDSTGYANSVVGAPTLDQFKDSYNAINEPDIDILNVTAGQSVAGIDSAKADGYVIKESTDTDYVYWKTIITSSKNKQDLYVRRTSYKNADGMWLASFSAVSASHVMEVHYNGHVDYIRYNNDTNGGVRPLVSLNSNVKLVDPDGDGIYDLQ